MAWDVTEEDIRRWVREENESIVAEKQAACRHLLSGTYPPDDPDNLFCDQCGKLVTLEDYYEDRERRVANPRVPLR